MKTSFSHFSRKILLSVLFWGAVILLWQAAAEAADREILLPRLSSIAQSMIRIVTDPVSWQSAGLTLIRVLKGTVISLGAAFALTAAAVWKPVLQTVFRPAVTVLSSVPNISYMILALIWLGNEGSVSAVTCLVLFPVLYSSIAAAVTGEEQSLRDVQEIYPETVFWRLRIHLLPMLVQPLLQSLKTAVQLGFKVGVMAEILGSVRAGIGRQMHFASLNLETADVIAWTILIILISGALSALLDLLLRLQIRKETV